MRITGFKECILYFRHLNFSHIIYLIKVPSSFKRRSKLAAGNFRREIVL
jgi:hypothetical protein